MMEKSSSERLREHPESRFASPQHAYDLADVAGRLKHEVQTGEDGHRQQTLYKQGSITVALFVFGHLTRLPPHRTDGVVIIHVLKGYLQITAETEVRDLRAGSLLVLAPNVQHNVVAYEESEMLLTVNMESSSK